VRRSISSNTWLVVETLLHITRQIHNVASLSCGDENPTDPKVPQLSRHGEASFWIGRPFPHIQILPMQVLPCLRPGAFDSIEAALSLHGRKEV
jgi:hypothetical protein